MKSWKIKSLFTLISLGIIAYFFRELHVARILEYMSAFELSAGLLLVPYACVLVCDSFGWYVLIPALTKHVSFFTVFRMKLFCDSVNNTLPAGTLIGDALKIKLLKDYGADTMQSSASVYVSRVLLVYAHAVYVLGAVLFSVAFLPLKSFVSVVVACVVVCFVVLGYLYYLVFYRGTITSILSVLKSLRVGFPSLEKHRQSLLRFDEKILSFYVKKSLLFGQSLLIFLLGWLFGGLELYVVMFYLDSPIPFETAIAIDALNAALKAVVFFVPAGLGVVEAGYIGLFQLVPGLSNPQELAFVFSLVKRLREIIFLTLGFLQAFFLKITIPNLKSLISRYSKTSEKT